MKKKKVVFSNWILFRHISIHSLEFILIVLKLVLSLAVVAVVCVVNFERLIDCSTWIILHSASASLSVKSLSEKKNKLKTWSILKCLGSEIKKLVDQKLWFCVYISCK